MATAGMAVLTLLWASSCKDMPADYIGLTGNSYYITGVRTLFITNKSDERVVFVLDQPADLDTAALYTVALDKVSWKYTRSLTIEPHETAMLKFKVSLFPDVADVPDMLYNFIPLSVFADHSLQEIAEKDLATDKGWMSYQRMATCNFTIIYTGSDQKEWGWRK